MSLARPLLLLCFFTATGVGCGPDYSDEHCADIVQQIHSALEDNVNKGILVRDAIACGEQGVANRPDAFDSRVPQSDVEYLQGAFRDACNEYQDHC